MKTAQYYAEKFSLPATRSQVRRLLAQYFKGDAFKKGNVRVNGEDCILIQKDIQPLLKLQLERILTLYYLQHEGDVKTFFKHLWSL